MIADRGLNRQAWMLENAQTQIRLAVKNGYLAGSSRSEINRKVQDIIKQAVKSINIPRLRDDAVRSLNAFATRQYSTLQRLLGRNVEALLALFALADDETPKYKKKQAEQRAEPILSTRAAGVPVQQYAKDYMRDKVQPVLDDLAEQNALDPGDVTGRNSLRNLAEMEMRYQDHLDTIQELKNEEIKLVVASVHADCSARCYPWQGRVYSLDGTSGTTADGKKYVPLETATDIYYTTKAGRTYKNGLLGFNCRHELVPYVPGMIIPHVSKEQQRNEYAVNTRQRALEREVRKWRERALMYKDVDREKYLEARRKAAEWNKRYKSFSIDNKRAYYPDRVRILFAPVDKVQPDMLPYIAKGYKLSDGTRNEDTKFIRDVEITEMDSYAIVVPKDLDRSKQHITEQEIAEEMQKVAPSLRKQAKEIQLVDYENPKDKVWRERYNMDGSSYSIGGNEMVIFFQNNSDDAMPHSLRHELGHNLDERYAKNGLRFSQQDEWNNARVYDAKDITDPDSFWVSGYGSHGVEEDFAESVAFYDENPRMFTEEYPARANIIRRLLE